MASIASEATFAEARAIHEVDSYFRRMDDFLLTCFTVNTVINDGSALLPRCVLMELLPDFAFKPVPPIASAPTVAVASASVAHLEAFAPSAPPLDNAEASELGPLRDLVGKWKGTGFNVIWRPHHEQAGDPPNQDRFLEINFTDETLEFIAIPGEIPNRGFLQDDIKMFGLRYLQQIADRNVKSGGKPAGLHIEPGIWAVVPATRDPKEPETVVRMASIPHGTTILAQGVALPASAGRPAIADTTIKPFAIGGGAGIDFPEQKLETPTRFRSKPEDIPGLSQLHLDNPNLFLKEAIAHQTILQTTTLVVSTDHTPVPGGGTANTVFLAGLNNNPNAVAAKAQSIFWIEKLEGGGFQLQYTQLVLLNFNGLSWPHISVATLRREPPTPPAVS